MRLRIVEKALEVVLITLLFLAARPAAAAGIPISSSYYCLLDGESGQVLLAKNSDTTRAVASTTKIMTAVVALEYCQPEEIALVSKNADQTAEYTIGLRSGQTLAVNELLKAALVRSANDAAVVLAEHVAGDEALFAHLMNLKAFCLGAFNSKFINASGLPASQAYSTAYDLAIISRYALANPLFRDLVGQRQVSFQHPGYRSPHIISNTNLSLLSSYPGATGVKTGTTDAAGKCLVGSARRQGRELIAVVLHSDNRTADCTRLLNYGFISMINLTILDNSQPFKELMVANGSPPLLSIYPADKAELWQGPQKLNIEKRVQINYSCKAPLPGGYEVGYVEVYSQGKLVKRIRLVGGNSVGARNNWISSLWAEFLSFKRNIGAGKE